MFNFKLQQMYGYKLLIISKCFENMICIHKVGFSISNYTETKTRNKQKIMRKIN